ncbi:MAG TPA: hypothetical protein VLF93_01180 [Candidatus Saccharimonadales bacterium]|nr:hypothetical protein [Candidatus Saccharimonadales bacterium]
MNVWETIFLSFFALFSFSIFIKGLVESYKKNAKGVTILLYWIGIFVWADAVVFGLFWFLASLFVLFIFRSWLLFLLIFSVFYLVRSIGETIYWFNQQFSHLERNPPHTLIGYRLFKDDSLWFVYQMWWQCIIVISVITTIYLTTLWIKTL